MITIYSTTHIYFRRLELFTNVENLTEQGLLELVKKDRNAVWFVMPHGYSVFKRKFIEGCMDDDCFLKEGFYSTELCGERVDYRIIEDANVMNARKKYADRLVEDAWRKIDRAHDEADPMLHEQALRQMRKADGLYP